MQQVNKLILILSIFFSLSSTGIARTINATGSGNWENSSTWGGTAPACGDTINIGVGKTVQITSVLDYTACGSSMWIVINGTMSFQTGKKLKLNCSSVVQVNSGGWINSGGGGGNSNLIEICTIIVWNTAMGNLPGPVTLSVTPLPVGLAYFAASLEKNFINLNWITYTEVNNDCFILEKSYNGKEYMQIGRIAGTGTSSNMNEYLFRDAAPVEGLQYYRLQQKDFDGKITYFKPIAIRWEGESVLTYFPNPGKGEIFVTVPQSFAHRTVRLMIQDMNWGVVIQRDITFGEKVVGIMILSKSEQLKPGNYLATLMLDDQKFTKLIMVQ